jgi:energy-coupling factor transport system substrate-specific component
VQLRKLLSPIIFGLSGLMGVIAFAYPFFMPVVQSADPEAITGRSGVTPLLALILLLLALTVLLIEVQGQVVSAKIVAALGLLVAFTAVLRFLEAIIPGPGGFSPIFVPIILAGYVFGARFGFLMGTMTLFVSALITGGVGPWLPYQMFAAGWIGLTAGWLPHLKRPALTLALLVVVSFAWGMVYGVIMNLYFWPFMAGDPGLSWQPGAGWRAAVERYLAFYLATSFVWDLAAAVGNVLLSLAFAMPALKALTRFRDRFHFEVHAL